MNNGIRVPREWERWGIGEYDIATELFWGSEQAKRIYGFDPDSKTFSIEKIESCIPEREKGFTRPLSILLKKTFHMILNLKYILFQVLKTKQFDPLRNYPEMIQEHR